MKERYIVTVNTRKSLFEHKLNVFVQKSKVAQDILYQVRKRKGENELSLGCSLPHVPCPVDRPESQLDAEPPSQPSPPLSMISLLNPKISQCSPLGGLLVFTIKLL